MIKKAVIHLGAYKTGTTSLQHHLRANAKTLSKAGVATIARQPKLLPVSLSLKRKMLNEIRDLEDEWRTLLKMDNASADRLIFSDEDLMDRFRPERWECLYPNAQMTVRGISQSLSETEARFILTIRDYADFLDSCYIQRLKMGMHYSAEDFKSRLHITSFSWVDLVERVRDACHPFGLSVFQFDRHVNERIMHHIQDFLDLPPLEFKDTKTINDRYSDIAIMVAQIANRSLASAGKKALRKFLQTHMKKKDTDRFTLFSQHERAQLNEKFSADVSRISSMAGERLELIVPKQ